MTALRVRFFDGFMLGLMVGWIVALGVFAIVEIWL